MIDENKVWIISWGFCAKCIGRALGRSCPAALLDLSIFHTHGRGKVKALSRKGIPIYLHKKKANDTFMRNLLARSGARFDSINRVLSTKDMPNTEDMYHFLLQFQSLLDYDQL